MTPRPEPEVVNLNLWHLVGLKNHLAALPKGSDERRACQTVYVGLRRKGAVTVEYAAGNDGVCVQASGQMFRILMGKERLMEITQSMFEKNHNGNDSFKHFTPWGDLIESPISDRGSIRFIVERDVVDDFKERLAQRKESVPAGFLNHS